MGVIHFLPHNIKLQSCEKYSIWLKMPFIKLYTNLSKEKLPEKFMPKLVDELSVVINKDKKWFNWILETDKCMSKGPDNEGAPYIWMEFRSIRTFDSKNCKELCPKLFDVVIKLRGL